MATQVEELYKAINALKEAVENKNKEAAEKASQDVMKNAPKGNRLTEFPIENANDLVTLHKSFSKDPNVVEFQKRADDLFIVSKILGIDPRQSKLYKDLWEPVSELRKAMTTASSGAGAEWIPTGFSADLIAKVELALKVAALHPRVKMPTDPFKIPALTGFSTAKLGSETTAPTASSLTTANIVLDAKKLITYVPLSYELEEDSIIAVLPLIKDDIVKALARAQENAAINGDDSTSHMDSDVSNAEDVRKAWKGYRKLAISSAKIDCAGGVTRDKLRALRKALGKYGIDQNELAWVVGISVYNQMLSLPEVITVDKYGPNATVLSGELAKFDGIPVIVSEYVREDLNATGVYDGTTTSKTIAILVRQDAFVFGDRRDVLIETFRDIKAQSIDVVASQRVAFSNRLPATDPIVGILYDITA
jgi:HK97 family phage major capsid protein